MEVFKSQLLIILLVAVAALLVVAVYKRVFAKMNQNDTSVETTSFETPVQSDDNEKPPKKRPVIRARGEAAEDFEEKGEPKDDGIKEDVEDNE